MKTMLKFLKNHKKESILAPLFKMLEALFDLFVPLIMADIIDNGIAMKSTDYILHRCLLLVVIGLVGLSCSITAQYFAARAAVESCAAIRHDLFDRIQSLGFSEMDNAGTNTLITRMTSDVNQVQSGLNLFLRLFLRSPFIVLGATVLSFTINIKAALIFVVTIPALSAVIFGIMLKSIPLYKNVQARLDKLTGITRENLTGIRVIRAFGREKDEVQQFENADSDLLSSQLHVGKISAMMNPLTYVIINLSIIAILNTGAIEINAGALTAGAVVALVNYMNQILLELVKLANLTIQITKAAACAERINTVLNQETKMQYGTLTPDSASSENAVEFRHVSLNYAGTGSDSLSDISFVAKKGQTIGIIGGTGSGKTSLVSLIPRYYDATSGTVLLFGHDIREYGKNALHKSVSTVMQKARLFTGTIRSNLKWGNGNADDIALQKALSIAQAADVVKNKSRGLDEPVEQGGRNFSGGQKQRLSIARSLVSDPDILILDDSSSALDYATDAALRKSLKNLSAGCTVFIVSQRANSIRFADFILVLDEGKLVGCGTHDRLLQECSVYRDIYESQFGKEKDA